MENQYHKKNIKIIKNILLILILIVLYLIIQSTYSKYAEQLNRETDFNISAWNIQFSSNDDIPFSFEEENTIKLKMLHYNDISNDVIVPGAIGYFDIYLNYEETKVPFEFNIESINNEEETIYNKFEIFSYVELTEGIDITESNFGLREEISEDIFPKEIDPTEDSTPQKNYRFFVKWDNINEPASNFEDVKFSKDHSINSDLEEDLNSIIKVKLTATQKNNV